MLLQSTCTCAAVQERCSAATYRRIVPAAGLSAKLMYHRAPLLLHRIFLPLHLPRSHRTGTWTQCNGDVSQIVRYPVAAGLGTSALPHQTVPSPTYTTRGLVC